MPRSRYSNISRKPGVHLAEVATSWLNAQSLVLDMISSVKIARDIIHPAASHCRGGHRCGRGIAARVALQHPSIVRRPAVDRDDRPGNVRCPVGREESDEIAALLGRANRWIGGDQFLPARGIAKFVLRGGAKHRFHSPGPDKARVAAPTADTLDDAAATHPPP